MSAIVDWFKGTGLFKASVSASISNQINKKVVSDVSKQLSAAECKQDISQSLNIKCDHAGLNLMIGTDISQKSALKVDCIVNAKMMSNIKLSITSAIIGVARQYNEQWWTVLGAKNELEANQQIENSINLNGDQDNDVKSLANVVQSLSYNCSYSNANILLFDNISQSADVVTKSIFKIDTVAKFNSQIVDAMADYVSQTTKTPFAAFFDGIISGTNMILTIFAILVLLLVLFIAFRIGRSVIGGESLNELSDEDLLLLREDNID